MLMAGSSRGLQDFEADSEGQQDFLAPGSDHLMVFCAEDSGSFPLVEKAGPVPRAKCGYWGSLAGDAAKLPRAAMLASALALQP